MISLQSVLLVTRKPALVLAFATVVAAVSASAQTLTTLTSFSGTNGQLPSDSLIADANGNLFGTTTSGGTSDFGTVFEIPKTTTGYSSTTSTLANFDSLNGANPFAGLIADANGNLFGTTISGGAGNDGTVFELVNNSGGYTLNTLINFNGANGAYPTAGLIADANGNLFGTTAGDGISTYGTVFELVNNSGGYTLNTLVTFDNTNGALPYAGLLADTNGNLFGTTRGDGSTTFGTVFELVKTSSGYTLNTLATFDKTNGALPFAGLLADTSGNLFGTTRGDGSTTDGTVFELVKTSSGFTLNTLITFNGANGAYPTAGLIADADGNLFGTTSRGGSYNSGTVFEATKTSSGFASTPNILINFQNNNYAPLIPYGGLIADGSGNLFGTSLMGGSSNGGTVFEVTSSGFVPPTHFAGTPGTANCVGDSISTLAQTYGGIAHATSSLGYSSVSDLQSAVSSYCAQ